MNPVLALFASPGLAGSVTRWRKTYGKDAHGNARSTGEAFEVITPASVEQINSVEVIGGRDAVTTAWQAFLPADADVLATDEIEWQGRRYLIDGDPFLRTGVVRALDHVQVNLQRKVG